MTHSVYFWLNDDADTAAFEAGLQALGAISAVKSIRVGKPAPTPERPVTDHSWSYNLVLEFDSVEDHNIYQDHPDHHAFVDSCKQFWNRAMVLDTAF